MGFRQRTIATRDLVAQLDRLIAEGVDLDALPLDWTIGQVLAYRPVTHCEYCQKPILQCRCLGE